MRGHVWVTPPCAKTTTALTAYRLPLVLLTDTTHPVGGAGAYACVYHGLNLHILCSLMQRTMERPVMRLITTQSRRGSGGFTLTELLVALAVLGTVTAMAAPSFTTLIESWRVRQTAEELQSTLYYARSEAIRRGGRVVIQKLPNNTNGCTLAASTGRWGCGWFVCDDANDNGTCGATETVLQRVDAPSGVMVQRTSGGDSIQFNRWGVVNGTWLGFTLVPKDRSVSHTGTRGVCMSSGGRVRVITQQYVPCTG